MANQAGPVCRLCRREGTKLFLKGSKCLTNCTFDKRNALLPGQHGLARRRKTSDYGIQLRAKQRARRQYGVLEAQFRTYFARAERSTGVTGTVLLQQLERRIGYERQGERDGRPLHAVGARQAAEPDQPGEEIICHLPACPRLFRP